MLEIQKTIKKMIENLKKEYQNGRKKALGEILLLIRKDIFDLLDNQGFNIKMTKKIIEQALNMKISDNTFYKWVERQRNWQKTDTKSNVEEVKEVSQPAPAKETKPKQKEVKNETPTEVKTDNTDDVLDEDMLKVVDIYKQN